MFSEEELLPLSGLQHLVYCERQCALIHIEQTWVENRFTAEGRLVHERTHRASAESRGDLVVARGLPIRSFALGLSGKADTVEFHRISRDGQGATAAGASARAGVRLTGLSGLWRPYPVEYKRGKPKQSRCDEVQICAQAFCLEEMLGVAIGEGALFYGRTRRRTRVVFDGALRRRTVQAAERFHDLFREGQTPRAVREPKCDDCSLLSVCIPDAQGQSAERYLFRLFEEGS